jgi:hypothetical protein
LSKNRSAVASQAGARGSFSHSAAAANASAAVFEWEWFWKYWFRHHARSSVIRRCWAAASRERRSSTRVRSSGVRAGYIQS